MTTRQMTLGEIETLAFDALRGAGTREPSAASLARAVVAAERDGTRSHGLLYVPIYCEHVVCGKVDGSAEPSLSQPRPSAIRVDAGTGFAHPAIDLGFESLVPATRETGCAGLGIYNSYNCGVLGYHVERLAEAGLFALGFTNAPASIAPVGGRIPVIGTNPFAMAVPDGAGAARLVIDQSASVIARSEIMLCVREGKAIPEGWALDADGAPTTDPAIAMKGSVLPSGGYKGFGVGILVEILAAALSGATLGKDASPFSGTAGGPPRTGQFFIAIDPGAFSGDAFHDRISGLISAIADQDGARLPGERRRASRPRTTADGVSVPLDLIARIEAHVAGKS